MTRHWVRLRNLRNGAIFVTADGILAVKSEYKYSNDPGGQSLCILLASGEYAHFPRRDEELVTEYQLDEQYRSMDCPLLVGRLAVAKEKTSG